MLRKFVALALLLSLTTVTVACNGKEQPKTDNPEVSQEVGKGVDFEVDNEKEKIPEKPTGDKGENTPEKSDTPEKSEEANKAESPEKPKVESSDKSSLSEYGKLFGLDYQEGQPQFAVAFLGYGDIMEFRHTYVEGVFESLGDFAIEQVGHINYEGDEWYLIVPKSKSDVIITDVDTGEEHIIPNGEAFTVRCNLSDLHSNIEISTETELGGHYFSPQVGGDGRLVPSPVVLDITDYTVLDGGEFEEQSEDSIHIGWAKSEGILAESDAAYFLPETICTRAMAVSFLWRMVASPEPAPLDNPFGDVSEEDEIFKSVMWAYGSDIVRVYSDGLFKPEDTCTKSDAISLLWNTAGQPLPEGTNLYLDLNDDDNATLAILWAVENGYVSDNGGKYFEPEEVCSCDMMLEMLYRFINPEGEI